MTKSDVVGRMEPNEKRSKSKSTRISLRRRTKLSSDEQSEGIGFHNQGTTIALTCVPKKCKKIVFQKIQKSYSDGQSKGIGTGFHNQEKSTFALVCRKKFLQWGNNLEPKYFLI